MKQVLLIVGMHRSGTSLCSGIFNILGGELGDDLISAAGDNERGFWENRKIVEANDRILKAMERSWDSPLPLPPQWPSLPAIEEEKTGLVRLLAEEFRDSEVVVIKDPRISRLLPLWLDILSTLKWSPRVVLCLRNPLEVADSLTIRNELPSSTSSLLWLRHSLEAEFYSRPFKRQVITYDQMLADWQVAIGPVAQGLGLGDAVAAEGIVARIDDFVAASLRHHNYVSEDLKASHDLRSLVSPTFAELSGEASATRLDELRAMLEVADYLYSNVAVTQPAATGESARAGTLARDVFSLQQAHERLAADNLQMLHTLGERLQHLEVGNSSSLTSVVEAQEPDEKRAHWEQLFQNVSRTVASQRELVGARSVALLAERDRQNAVDIKRTLESALRDADSRNRRAEAELVVLRCGAADANNSLSEVRVELAIARGLLDGRESEVRQLSDSLASAEERVRQLEIELADRRAIGPQPEGAGGSHNGSSSIYDMALRAYHGVGVSADVDLRLKDLLFRRVPAPFKSTNAYRAWSIRNQAETLHGASDDSRVWRDAGSLTAVSNTTSADGEVVVSVVIPVYNQFDYTMRCLASINGTDTGVTFEIIVMDDGSTDQTAEVLSDLPGITYIRNEENLGFLRNCNKGSAASRGRYVLFLNNDTEVTPGWLDELVLTFENIPEAGLVGSQLINVDGSMQEAGGIVWRDGSAWNYGRNGDVQRPEYSYLRDVDYCSGACIMLPRELFDKLGRFDERFAPAYYEDTDIAFSVREAGFRVLYQPLSKVIHYEGASCGTDVRSGIKAKQTENQRLFSAKWRATLADHAMNGQHPELEKERRVQRRILMLDACTPTPDKDSGSVDTVSYMQILSSLGYKITFIPVDNFSHDGGYTENLQRMGVESIYSPFESSVSAHLRRRGHEYDVVMLYRCDYAARHIADVKHYCSQAQIVFNTVDLHYLRMSRQAEVEKSKLLHDEAIRVKRVELGVMERSDQTIVLSEAERQLLVKEGVAPEKLKVVPLVREIPGRKRGYGKRKDIIFVGGFRHTPNVDAMHFFVDEVWPIIRQKLPKIRLHIIGSHMPREIKNLAGKGINVVGFVPELGSYFDVCRLSVAPLRYGAGLKGKVGASLAYGLPCVATSIAVEGSGLVADKHVLVENTPNEFAAAVCKLYKDKSLWASLSDAGLQFADDTYSIAAGTKKLVAVLESTSN